MAANINDNFLEVGLPGSLKGLGAAKAVGATTIQLSDSIGWPTATAVIFAIDTVDSSGKQTSNSYSVWKGTVSGTTVTINPTPLYGTDQPYPNTATTRVYIPVSTFWANSLTNGLLVSHKQDGTLKDNAVTTTSIAANAVVTAKIADGAITSSKLSMQAWQSWAPTFANFTMGNGTVDAKYIQIGKTVHGRIVITGGSTSSVAGIVTWTPPVTPNAIYASSVRIPIGVMEMEDAGIGNAPGYLLLDGTSSMQPLYIVSTTAGSPTNWTAWTPSNPFAFGTADSMQATFTYEAA